MADIDQLSIQIKADANQAEQSINKLIERLRALNLALDLGNISNFTRQLNQIKLAADSLKDIGTGIRSLSDAGSKLAQLTGVKTLTEQTKEAEDALRKLAKQTGEAYRFDLSGTKQAKKDIDDLYNDLMKFYGMVDKIGGTKGKTIKSDVGDALGWTVLERSNAVDEWKAVVSEMQEYKEVSDYIRSHPLTLNSGMKEDFLGGRQFKEAFDLFGHKLHFSKDGLLDLTEYFEELQRLTGYVPTGEDMSQKFQNLISFLEQGQEGLRNAVVHGREIISKGLIPYDTFKETGDRLAKEVAGIYDRVKAESVKNPFDGIVKGLQSLQDITLPDFSGLKVLAEGVSAISGINVKKLTLIADALKLFKDTGFTNLNVTNEGATAKTEAEFVNIKNALGEIRSSLQQIAGVMMEFSGMGSALAAGFEEFKAAVTGTAEIIASIHEALIAIGYDVDNLPSLFDAFGAGRNAEMSAELLQAIASFTELTKIADVAKNSMESLSTAIDGLKGKVGEIPVKKEIDKTGESADKATEKLSALDQKVKEVFESGWTQDSLSAEIARSISDIDKFKAAMSDMTKKPEIFDAQQFIHFSQQVEIAERVWKNFQQSVARKVRIGGGLDEASKQLQFIIDRRHDVQEALSNMDSGKVGANVEQYRALREELAKLDDEYARLTSKKEEFEKPAQIDLLANLVALGHEIWKISNSLNRIGDVGIKALKTAFKPLEYVIKEYKEKIDGLADSFRRMAQNAKKHLDKLSAFWRRSMKTFTFMLVRKAITAVLTEIGDAVKSLALWSKQFGTVFNDSMSHITSNLSYMARAIVGAFEPLINFIVPAFNALADAVANVAARVGEFFAAMTGQGYYMKAKKQLTDYGESVEKARKAQKNLIAGLDDLNVITTPTSTDTGMDDVAEQWEKMDVSDKMKNFAQDVKDLAKRLFDPIKKAWDAAGDHVIKGWKYMTSELGKLAKDIGRDFLKVWEQPETQKIFENIFHAVGYIEEGIGHLARNFREAWNENETGLHILEGIRNIILDITEHVKNMAKEFRDWANELTFKPLLNSLNVFLQKIRPFMDFLGSLAEEWWQRVILRHWKWLIEEGLPHLLTTVGEVAEAFHWDKILEDLKPVMDAFETMRENIETGLVNAFGNLGKRVAEFANSEDFTKFTANVAWFMDQITAERVEKLFTALGDAILNVAESLMRFVGSDTFKDFMQKIFDWYDSLSTEDIAGFITDIAIAIAAFKFTAFIGTGLAKFFEFLSVLQGLKGLGGVSGLLGGAAGGASIGATLTALGTAAAVIAAVIAAIYSLVESFGGIQGTLEEVGKHIAIIKDGLSEAFENSGIADSIANLKEKFGQLLEALGNQKSVWQALFYIIDASVILLGGIVIPVFDALIDLFAASFEIIGGLADLFGGLFDVLKGFFTGDSQLVSEGWERMCQGFKDAFQGVFDFLAVNGGLVQKLVHAIAGFFSWLKEVLIGDPIVLDTTDGIISAFAGMVKDVTEAIAQFVADMVEKFIELKDKVLEKVQELKEKAIQKFKELKDKVLSKIQELKEKAIQKFNELKNTVISRIEEMKNNVLSKVEEMKNNVVSKAEELKNNAVARFNQLKDDATSAVENLKSNAISAFENLKSNVVGIAERASRDASQWFWQLNDWASEAFWSIVNGAGSILGNIGSTISGAFSGVKSSVQSAFSDAKTWLTGVGNDIVSGLSGGITSAANTTTFYKNTATPSQVAINANRKKIDGHSPSRVFMDIGKDIVDGLDIGITKNAKSTEKAVDTWLDSVLDIDIPVFDVRSVLPNSNMKLDTYAHTQFSGTVDSTAIQQGVREGVQEAIGSLILPYLNDIAQSSRETAAKEIKIGDKAIGQAASRYAKDYQIRTGRPAYGY